MSRKKGTVTGIGKSQYSYFIQLDGDQFYYNTKFEPKCGKDDVVGITFSKTDEKRGNISKVEILEKNSDGYKSTSTGSDYKRGSQYTSGTDNRQDSIVFQSSRKDALVFVSILLGAEAFPVKGKADARRVQIEELLDELTSKFFAAAIDPRNSSVLSGAASKDGGDTDDSWGGDKDEEEGDSWERDDDWPD